MDARHTWILSGLLVLSAACGGSTGEHRERAGAKAGAPAPTVKDPAATVATPKAADARSPGLQPDGSIVSAVEWFHGSLEEALARAAAEGKLVLVDVGAYWCPPCHQLDEETFVDPAVGAHLADKYVAVHIDAEKGEGPDVVERYRIQAYPTILVLEAAGVEKDRIIDFIEPPALLQTLGKIEGGGNVIEGLEKAVADDAADLEAAYAYGHALALAARRDEAIAQFDRVLAGDADNAKGLAAQAAFDRAMFITYKIDGDHPGAVAAYRDLQAKYPDSDQAIGAYRQLGRVLNDMGKPDEAIAELEAMIAKKPDDVSLKSSYGWFSFREKCRPEKGLAAVEAGLKQDPESAGLYYLKAELHHLLGDDGAGLKAIEQASELEPKKAYYRRQVQRFTELAGKPG